MSRGPYSFKKSDISRAHDAVPDAIIEVDIARKCLRIVPRRAGEATTTLKLNDLDRELDEFEARHG